MVKEMLSAVEKRELIERYPLLHKIIEQKPVLWKNPDYIQKPIFPVKGTGIEIMDDAKARFQRFEPVLNTLFPIMKGKIISPLSKIEKMKVELQNRYQKEIKGQLLLKRDDSLPVAGSIKARGGFHEVLAAAEKIALKEGIIHNTEDDYRHFLSKTAKAVFNQYTISVGSTGNLGLSIGMIGSSLGFQVDVHMSADAKQWKKDLLRKNGVNVVEYESDYSVAVEHARKESEGRDQSYFVDDENSQLLFAGYAVAALELKEQLDDQGIMVDADHPLHVYLPCGVGGGPGGIAFGLKSIFGEHVHVFFAEPTHSPCMLVGLMTKLHHHISVQDFGLDNKTEADGLAVGRPSLFVGELMEELLTGIYTIEDDDLFKLEYLLYQSEAIFLEPSALAGMKGAVLIDSNADATHLVWATGGSLVPQEMRDVFLKKGKAISEKE